jgi:hypothetical protein
MVVQFRDDRSSSLTAFPGLGDPLVVRDSLQISTGDDLQSPGANLARIFVDETVGGKKPTVQRWRRIVVEVNDDGFLVTFTPNAASDQPVLKPAPLSRDALLLIDQRASERLATYFPALADGPLQFTPQGGCGLYVHNASVSYRNVVFQPLP